MELEKLEKAKGLQSQIVYLKERIKSFNPENRYVHLIITDEYGNKRGFIKTFALDRSFEESAGYDFAHFIADAYSNFLAEVQTELQKRIDILQLELKNL